MTEVEELKLIDKNTLTIEKKQQLRKDREIVYDTILDELRHIAFEYLTKKRDSDLIDSYIFTITDKLHQLKLINELLDEINNSKSLGGIMKDIQKSIEHTKIYITEELELGKSQEDLDGLSRGSTEEQIKLAVVKIIEKELYYIKNIVYKDEIVGIWIGDEQYLKHFLGDSIESLYFNEAQAQKDLENNSLRSIQLQTEQQRRLPRFSVLARVIQQQLDL